MKKIILTVAVVLSLIMSVNTALASYTDENTYLYESTLSEITVSSNSDFANITSGYADVYIKGSSAGILLSLPSEISLAGNTKIDNITLSGASTIYANGYTLEIGSNVTSDSRLTVYGGKKSSALTGDTNLILLGGLYNNIFAGGNGGAVNGNTNVVLGGNANSGDDINDDASNISPCYVYGGGNNGKVTGKTSVTLRDNAVAKYLVGAGYNTNGTAPDTNIYIEGGKVMNVYAGSRNTALTNCDTHITMTGGMAEALFGGCESVSMNGNTYITVKSGEVTRRIYTGCYNNWSIGISSITSGGTWSSDNFVTGTTTLSLYPDAKLNTGTGLSSDNKMNTGVFAGSRTKSSHTNEINSVIYMNNCYSTHNQYIGEKSKKYSISLSGWLKSFHNYVIKVAAGGTVYGTSTAGQVYIEPDESNYGLVDGSGAYINENASVSGTSEITFNKNFAVNTLSASFSENSATVNVDYVAENVKGTSTPNVYVAVYSEADEYIASNFSEHVSGMTSATISVDGKYDTSKKHYIKAFIWDANNLKPLATPIITEVTP